MSYTCDFLARSPVVLLLISTNFRTQPLALNVNIRIRNLLENFTYCLFDFCLTVHHQLGKVIQMNQLDATMIY